MLALMKDFFYFRRNGHDSHSKSPDPNGTYTQNVYKDAIAMFSNTLHFSGTAEDDKAYESSFQNFGSGLQ